MHRFIMTVLTLSVLVLIAAFGWAAPNIPADTKLGPPMSLKTTKPLVPFSHSLHDKAKIECASCHHTWDGKSEIKLCSTAGCHDQPGKKGVNAFYTAFHSKKSKASCLGCHKIVKKEQKKAVPVSCKSCHPK